MVEDRFIVRLPNPTAVIIETEKVRDYLLSSTHPVGRFKAAFFGMLGYTQEDWAGLTRELREIAALDTLAEAEFGRYGNKYRIAANVVGPSGRSASIVTVWIVRHGESVPRFVTAFPGEKP